MDIFETVNKLAADVAEIKQKLEGGVTGGVQRSEELPRMVIDPNPMNVGVGISDPEATQPEEIDYSTWRPEQGDDYYLINSLGGVEGFYSNVEERTIQNIRNSISGGFATQEHADTWKRINDRYWGLMKGVKLDWGDASQAKFHLYYHHGHKKVIKNTDCIGEDQGTNYMTEEAADKLLSEFTQAELKLWVLGGARR